MPIRWQKIGTTSHAVEIEHQPVAGEVVHTLCTERHEVTARDARDPLDALACQECDDIAHDRGLLGAAP